MLSGLLRNRFSVIFSGSIEVSFVNDMFCSEILVLVKVNIGKIVKVI